MTGLFFERADESENAIPSPLRYAVQLVVSLSNVIFTRRLVSLSVVMPNDFGVEGGDGAPESAAVGYRAIGIRPSSLNSSARFGSLRTSVIVLLTLSTFITS